MKRKNYIIVPYRFGSAGELGEIITHYADLLRRLKEIDGVVIIVNYPRNADGEKPNIHIKSNEVLALDLPDKNKSNGNQKLDAIYYAIERLLELSNSDFNGYLFDDDARPTDSVILSSIQSLNTSNYSYRLCIFKEHNFINMIEQSGLYVYNTLSRSPQIWANLSIAQINRLPLASMDSDHLYDERYLIDWTIGTIGTNFCYTKSPSLEIVGSRDIQTYINQKLRYCYENLKIPSRFIADLAVLPSATLLAISCGINSILICFALISAMFAGCSFRYWVTLPPAERSPFWANFLGVLWYVPYPLLAWIVLPMRLTIGIKFGANRILRP